ncbi:MAG: chorismate mutase [Eubacteriales bacterium]
MNRLEQLRSDIDKIDVQLISLFEKRMDISQEIAEYKENNGLCIYDESREKQVITKNLENAQEKYRKYIKDFIFCVMKISKDVQQSELEKR